MKDQIKVTTVVDRTWLLNEDPARVRQQLGEGAYQAALRKVEPAKPPDWVRRPLFTRLRGFPAR